MPDCPYATADELWAYCLEEYASTNPISQRLFDHFFLTLKRIVDLLAPGDRLLEVGCGAAFFSRRIMEMLRGQHLEISDLDFRYISKLRANEFPAPGIVESASALARPGNSFDCVFCLEVLEHIPAYKPALAELFRVSRQCVVLSVPNEPNIGLPEAVRRDIVTAGRHVRLCDWSLNTVM